MDWAVWFARGQRVDRRKFGTPFYFGTDWLLDSYNSHISAGFVRFCLDAKGVVSRGVGLLDFGTMENGVGTIVFGLNRSSWNSC